MPTRSRCPAVSSNASALRDRSAMVFQHYNLFPHKTVLQNVVEGPVVVQRRPAAEADAEARALLDRVGLTDKTDGYPSSRRDGGRAKSSVRSTPTAIVPPSA